MKDKATTTHRFLNQAWATGLAPVHPGAVRDWAAQGPLRTSPGMPVHADWPTSDLPPAAPNRAVGTTSKPSSFASVRRMVVAVVAFGVAFVLITLAGFDEWVSLVDFPLEDLLPCLAIPTALAALILRTGRPILRPMCLGAETLVAAVYAIGALTLLAALYVIVVGGGGACILVLAIGIAVITVGVLIALAIGTVVGVLANLLSRL